MPVILRNPHSVLAALKVRPQDVLEVVVPSEERSSRFSSAQQEGSEAVSESDVWGQVRLRAQKLGIPLRSSKSAQAAQGSRGRSSRMGNGPKDQSLRLGGSEATVRERAPVASEELFSGATSRAEGRGLWLALDCLQDPQNVGAIFRAAAFFGVQGILLTQERSASLTGTVYDVASGGLEFVPFVVQANLQRGFEVAKKAGLWVLGTSEHAQEDVAAVACDRPWLLVLGNEEKGIRRLTEESCDV
ncbi:MAG: 23S rRNA (guanosine(2251)-2'-O)-methyltransferase RlmB, partial [Bdellovibrionia bacterium]